MKKFLCVMLAVLMSMSCIVYAAPQQASTVTSITEPEEQIAQQENDDTAALSQETDPVKTIFIEFENAVANGYNIGNMTNLSKENGVLSFEAEKNDPRVTIPVNFDADDYGSIKIRMKWEGIEREGSTPAIQLFYVGYDKDGNYVTMQEAYSVKAYPGLSSDGEYKVITLSLTNSNLKGMNITSLGFDPMCNNGTASLDYLMIVPKNDRPNREWHFNTDGASDGWKFNGSNGKVENGVYSGYTDDATNKIFYTSGLTKLKGADYPKAYIRMMFDGSTKSRNTLFYTNLVDEADTQIKGWSSSYTDKNGNSYTYATHSFSTSNNGVYKLYEYNFGQYVPYSENYISALYYNVQSEATNLNLDYVIFPHKNHFEWDFEAEDYLDGLTLSSVLKHENGYIRHESTPESEYVGTSIHLNGISIDADDWAGVEVVMKHDVFTTGSSNRLQLYYAGTTEDGNEIKYTEVSAAAARIADDKRSTGEGSVLYYIDFQNLPNWSGSTITSLRIDPLKAYGCYEVDYIRLVPMPEGVNEPLDEKDMKLTYEFEDEKAGTADGTITVDFGSQIINSAESVVLNWASGNSTDGYTALADYTAIKKLDGDEAAAGYTINKNMLIPAHATAVIATIKDCDKTFTLA